MSVYLSLFFSPASGSKGTLKQWLMKMGSEVHAGDPLFSYRDGKQEGRFKTPIPGTLKVYLIREGDELEAGNDVVVLSCAESAATVLQNQGLGKILKPEEYKSALEHAEAASIRLPPEDL